MCRPVHFESPQQDMIIRRARKNSQDGYIPYLKMSSRSRRPLQDVDPQRVTNILPREAFMGCDSLLSQAKEFSYQSRLPVIGGESSGELVICWNNSNCYWMVWFWKNQPIRRAVLLTLFFTFCAPITVLHHIICQDDQFAQKSASTILGHLCQTWEALWQQFLKERIMQNEITRLHLPKLLKKTAMQFQYPVFHKYICHLISALPRCCFPPEISSCGFGWLNHYSFPACPSSVCTGWPIWS